MTTFGKNFKAIPLKHQPAHVKFIHNQLRLSNQQYQQSPINANTQDTRGNLPSFSTLPPELQPSKQHKNHAKHHPES